MRWIVSMAVTTAAMGLAGAAWLAAAVVIL
jgi:hypothetical protein